MCRKVQKQDVRNVPGLLMSTLGRFEKNGPPTIEMCVPPGVREDSSPIVGGGDSLLVATAAESSEAGAIDNDESMWIRPEVDMADVDEPTAAGQMMAETDGTDGGGLSSAIAGVSSGSGGGDGGAGVDVGKAEMDLITDLARGMEPDQAKLDELRACEPDDVLSAVLCLLDAYSTDVHVNQIKRLLSVCSWYLQASKSDKNDRESSALHIKYFRKSADAELRDVLVRLCTQDLRIVPSVLLFANTMKERSVFSANFIDRKFKPMFMSVLQRGNGIKQQRIDDEENQHKKGGEAGMAPSVLPSSAAGTTGEMEAAAGAVSSTLEAGMTGEMEAAAATPIVVVMSKGQSDRAAVDPGAGSINPLVFDKAQAGEADPQPKDQPERTTGNIPPAKSTIVTTVLVSNLAKDLAKAVDSVDPDAERCMDILSAIDEVKGDINVDMLKKTQIGIVLNKSIKCLKRAKKTADDSTKGQWEEAITGGTKILVELKAAANKEIEDAKSQKPGLPESKSTDRMSVSPSSGSAVLLRASNAVTNSPHKATKASSLSTKPSPPQKTKKKSTKKKRKKRKKDEKNSFEQELKKEAEFLNDDDGERSKRAGFGRIPPVQHPNSVTDEPDLSVPNEHREYVGAAKAKLIDAIIAYIRKHADYQNDKGRGKSIYLGSHLFLILGLLDIDTLRNLARLIDIGLSSIKIEDKLEEAMKSCKFYYDTKTKQLCKPTGEVICKIDEDYKVREFFSRAGAYYVFALDEDDELYEHSGGKFMTPPRFYDYANIVRSKIKRLLHEDGTPPARIIFCCMAQLPFSGRLDLENDEVPNTRNRVVEVVESVYLMVLRSTIPGNQLYGDVRSMSHVGQGICELVEAERYWPRSRILL